MELRMAQIITDWRHSEKHLPSFMRDFHHCKDLFKTIASAYPRKPDDNYHVDWVPAQVYTTDKFLWFMAGHGYTLQRSRAALPFNNIHETIAMMKADQIEALHRIIAMEQLPAPTDRAKGTTDERNSTKAR